MEILHFAFRAFFGTPCTQYKIIIVLIPIIKLVLIAIEPSLFCTIFALYPNLFNQGWVLQTSPIILLNLNSLAFLYGNRVILFVSFPEPSEGILNATPNFRFPMFFLLYTNLIVYTFLKRHIFQLSNYLALFYCSEICIATLLQFRMP